jgi:hypothetical protein
VGEFDLAWLAAADMQVRLWQKNGYACTCMGTCRSGVVAGVMIMVVINTRRSWNITCLEARRQPSAVKERQQTTHPPLPPPSAAPTASLFLQHSQPKSSSPLNCVLDRAVPCHSVDTNFGSLTGPAASHQLGPIRLGGGLPQERFASRARRGLQIVWAS